MSAYTNSTTLERTTKSVTSPTCPQCNDTGYTQPYNGGPAIPYTCPYCAIGEAQWQAEIEYYNWLDRDYQDAQAEQQYAGVF